MSESTGYLSASEVEAIQHLHKRAPYSITDVSRGFFSIAMRAGGAVVNGSRYTYIPPHDELVRDDVLRAVAKLRKKAKPAPAPAQKQKELL